MSAPELAGNLHAYIICQVMSNLTMLQLSSGKKSEYAVKDRCCIFFSWWTDKNVCFVIWRELLNNSQPLYCSELCFNTTENSWYVPSVCVFLYFYARYIFLLSIHPSVCLCVHQSFSLSKALCGIIILSSRGTDYILKLVQTVSRSHYCKIKCLTVIFSVASFLF